MVDLNTGGLFVGLNNIFNMIGIILPSPVEIIIKIIITVFIVFLIALCIAKREEIKSL
ncbi:MAG: hypothetical protein ABH821_01870 [archaeon]